MNKAISAVIPFALLVAAGLPAADAPARVGRSVLVTVEKSLDDRFTRLWDDNPLALLGSTRGVYLDGYGAVFTAEVNPVVGGVTLMHPNWTKDDKDRHRKKKLDRIPRLRAEMKQALMAAAATLDPMPADQQVVLSVFLSRYPWEDPAGIPAQVTMQATKRKLLDAQQANGAGLDQAISVKEY
jgi:hypothetical protein